MYRTNWSAFSVPEFNDAQDNIKTINLDSLTDGICDAGYWAQPWIRRMASSIFRGDVPDSVLARVEVVSPSAAEHLRYVRAAGEYGALDFTNHRAVLGINNVDTSQFSAYSVDSLTRLTTALGRGPVSNAVEALTIMAPIAQAIALRHAERVLAMIGAPDNGISGATATGSLVIDVDTTSDVEQMFPDRDITAWSIIHRSAVGHTVYLTADSRHASDADSILTALHRQIGELGSVNDDRSGSPLTVRGSISLIDCATGREIRRFGSPES